MLCRVKALNHILRKGAFNLFYMQGQQKKNVSIKFDSTICTISKAGQTTRPSGGLTFSSFAYSKIVCWLSSLRLCPDVHCVVTLNWKAVSDYRALFFAEFQSLGKQAVPFLWYKLFDFFSLKAKQDIQMLDTSQNWTVLAFVSFQFFNTTLTPHN